MSTLKKSATFTSIALMTGKECTVQIEPSEKKGIRYHFKDGEVEGRIENVISTDHCVVFGNKEVKKIVLTEHFSAACAICGIDSLDVYLSHYEMPIGDGSSKPWTDLFKETGIVGKTKESYRIASPVSYLNGKTHCVVLPSDKFRITYGVNYNHKELNNRWVSMDLKEIDQVTEARTFGYLKELKMLQMMGFARGAKEDNAVGMTEDGGYTTTLRSPYEPVRHKILDLIGDFFLTGTNPLNWKAEIIVKEAGHTVHYKTALLLKDKIIKE
jgi:UDP-3-O-acyl-N-acetylglucosamine deacetylase